MGGKNSSLYMFYRLEIFCNLKKKKGQYVPRMSGMCRVNVATYVFSIQTIFLN